MIPDIREWKQIDEAWLTAALKADGLDADVAGFVAQRVGTGQIGDCVRFELDYASAPEGAPRTLVGKFPSEGEESRSTGVALGNYHREVKFYQILRDRARISTPYSYFAEVDENTHDFVLLMSDASPAEQGDQLAGVSIAEAMTVMGEAAKLHAAFWNDATLDQYPWVSGTSNAPELLAPEMFVQLWEGFKQRYSDRLTERAQRVGDSYTADMEAHEPMRAGNRSLIHTDFRPDNMLFATPAGGDPLTVVDWQSFAYGPPASDIGYFIAGALTPDERKQHEDSLIGAYLAELERQGAGPYRREELTRHYIAGAYQLFTTAYVAAMLVTQTARGDDMFFRMLNGAVDLIFDHGADSVD
ncbi:MULTISPECIES: phosphotransferase [Pacificimonas]|uniref:Phosphotransferase n=1 Tax=Pacificimonas aurantium TaxID=1250540 RepID=A0ABS7WHJ1_9SPHN|nr:MULTISPECIES: phosphotransferase [Pacificimonas]MBZ6377847.1 phosphotransferase [Pacificimonas aurantium]